MALVPYENGGHIFQAMHQPRQTFEIGENSIDILQSYSTSGVAGCVWRSSVVLSKFIAQHPTLVCGKSVIELGAGTGLLGISCHKLGARIVSTDHEDFLTSLEQNFDLNHIDSKMYCKALNWGADIKNFLSDNDLTPPDIVLGADIIYVKETFDLLMKTLIDFSAINIDCKIYLACQIRYEKDKKFIENSKVHFIVKEVPQGFDDNIHVYCLSSKPQLLI